MTIVQDEAAQEALRWVVGLLDAHDVPFEVVGGLAARAYGATRPLADMDLYIPGAHVATVLEAAEPFVTRPAARHLPARSS